MQYLAKAVQYYKDINPATLTGAIDVIVVERTNEAGELELACSPFHVRFGKLSVLRPIDKKVRITVNDEPIPFFMKVGETGEAFFVFETDADLPEDMQTSPLAGPLTDVDSPGEPEFLDLDAEQAAEVPDADSLLPLHPQEASTSSIDSSPTTSRYASMNQTQLNSPVATFHSLQPSDASADPLYPSSPSYRPTRIIPAATAALVGVVENASSLGRAAITGLSSNVKLQDLTGRHRANHTHTPEEEARIASRLQEFDELEAKMKADLGGLSLDDRAPGDEVRKAARERDEDVNSMLDGKSAKVNGDAAPVSFHPRASMDGELSGGPESNGDLMLDISGYKIEEGDVEKSERATEAVLAEELGLASEIIDEGSDKELVAFTQGLLQSADPKTLSGFFGPVEPSPAHTPAATTPAALDDRRPPLPSFQSGASVQTMDDTLVDPERKERGDGIFQISPKQFSLKFGEKLHVFELSLGGGPTFGQDLVQDEQSFVEHQVTSSQFMTSDTLTGHANLVVKYSGRYLTWENASPVLASLAVYRKSLVDHPEYHRLQLDQDTVNAIGLGETKRYSRGWGLWWGKKGATASTSSLPLPGPDVSPPTSPPVTRPSSPRSLPLPSSPLALPTNNQIAPTDKRHYAKTLRLTSDQLRSLGLKKGMNVISFSVRSSYSGFAICTSRIFLWDTDYQVVISDIDGTITKSDALGHVFTMIGRDWTHLGVAKLYTDIARNGYKMMYLTSRAIGQADTTREYLRGIKQNGYQLPEGPVIMSPDRLMTSLHREVVLRKPEVFKMACLRDIQRLFSERSPFYAGFGNRITDALSYRSVDIPSSRIFTIDTNGEVKMELLELAGYKSSYIHMTDLVDQMFPPINRKTAPAYTDFNFWRTPVTQFELPDFPPASPALSARSDTSRLGLKRLGSLVPSLSRRSSRSALAMAKPTGSGTPSSPLLQATLVEEPNGLSEDEEYDNERSESSSMPGSLPNDSDFESRYRASQKARNTTAEEYRDEVQARDGEEEVAPEEEGEEFGEELDFSSVPYL